MQVKFDWPWQKPSPVINFKTVTPVAQPQIQKESKMSFSTIVLDVEKGIEVGVADALKIFGAVEAKSPAAITALTALAGSVEAALASVAADTNVATLTLTLPTTIADIKVIWPEAKAFLATLGVK